jgi:uncharacterized protein YcfJ
MPKQHLLTFTAGLLALVTGSAFGSTSEYTSTAVPAYYVTVPVLAADPIYNSRTVEHPIRQCTTDAPHQPDYRHNHDYRSADEHAYPRYRPRPRYIVPGLIGGIVGGLIGNQFGGGRGNKALTVIGALAGSSIARETARRHDQSRVYQDYHHAPTRVCHTTYESEIVESIDGYEVTYQYSGQQFTKRLSEHPGDHIRIRVQVSPIGGYDSG